MIKKMLFRKNLFDYTKYTAGINLKPKEFSLKEGERAICLAPHADDESIGMGGTLALNPEKFEVILLTDGRKGVKNTPTDEVIESRKKEFESAMKVAKIQNYSFLNCKDKELLFYEDKFCKLEISSIDYIFVPNLIDQHPDHKAVSINLNKLLKQSKHKKNLKICFYEVWSALGFVNGFVDIERVIETKKEMIASYPSQTSQKNYEYHALGLNQYRGMLKNKKYVEAFCILSVEDFEKICKMYE